MLTVADARHLSNATVFRDVTWAGADRNLTSTFYVLLDAPALATSADGGPAYSFFWYRGASPPSAGGLLTAGITASPSAADYERLSAEIRSAFDLAADADVTIAPMAVEAGTVSLAFAAEAGAANGEFTTAVLGDGPARQTGSDVATFAVALTADGAALLAQALDRGQALLSAQFDLAVPYVLDDVSLRIWCDVANSCRAAADLRASGDLTPATLVKALTSRHLAGSTQTSARPLSDDERQALADLGSSLLGGLLPATLLGSDNAPKPYTAELEQRLNVSLTATYPATRDFHLTANLALPASADIRASRVSLFDLAADGLLAHVEVSAAGDLAAHGIAAVAVRLEYNGTKQDGTAIQRTSDLVLRPGTQTAVAAFDLATPDQRTLVPHVQVHFVDGSAPFAFDLPPTDSDAVTLDIDALGVLVVDCALGVIDLAAGASVIVEFTYGTTAACDATRVLTSSSPHATWTAVVREAPSAYRYRVAWTAGELRIPGDWQTSTDRSLVLDAPAGLTPASTTVTVMSAGDFAALAAVVVELRASADAPVTVLQFTAADQTSTWTAAGAPQPFGYHVRQTVVLRAGTHVAGAWHDETRTVLIARDVLRYDVVVVPRLLSLGTAASRAVVQIQSPDPAAAVTTVVLTRPDDQPLCPIRLLDPDDHTYRYQLTVSPRAGLAHTTDWLTDTSSILVLRPPT